MTATENKHFMAVSQSFQRHRGMLCVDSDTKVLLKLTSNFLSSSSHWNNENMDAGPDEDDS